MERMNGHLKLELHLAATALGHDLTQQASIPIQPRVTE